MIEVIRFNRREVFNKGDYDAVKRAIDAISLSNDRDTATNYLYGLYDGLLYPELLSTIKELEITHPELKKKYDMRVIIMDIESVLEHIYYYIQEVYFEQ